MHFANSSSLLVFRSDITLYFTMGILQFILLTILTAVPTLCEDFNENCPPKQNLELGKEGIIRCSFEGCYGIYWYDTGDLTDYAFLNYVNGLKGGSGYSSGEFDVQEDGSLVIESVNVKHEIMFTVACIKSRQNNTLVRQEVLVTTIAHPNIPYPNIAICDTKQYCFTELSNTSILTCSTSDARPAIPVEWSVRTTEGDHNITLEMDTIISDDVVTMIAKMKYQHISPLQYHMFVCKADDHASLLESTDSFVLAGMGSTEIDSTKIVYIQIHFGDTITMACPGVDTLFFVWKKMHYEDGFEIIAHGYVDGEHSYDQRYGVNDDGVLVMKIYEQNQTGIFVCYASNGIQEYMTTYNVTQIDQPLVTSSVTVHVTPTDREKGIGVASLIIPIILVLLVPVVISVVVYLYFKGKLWKCGRSNRSAKALQKVQSDEEDVGISLLSNKSQHSEGEIIKTETLEDIELQNDVTTVQHSEGDIRKKNTSQDIELQNDVTTVQHSVGEICKNETSQDIELQNDVTKAQNSEGEIHQQELSKDIKLKDDETKDIFTELYMTEGDDQKTKRIGTVYCIGLLDLIMIRGNSTNTNQHVSVDNVISIFLSRLISADYRSILIFNDITNSDLMLGQSSETVDSEISYENNSQTTDDTPDTNISCRDALLEIYNSCDIFVREKLLRKMSECQLAIPILFPTLDNKNVIFPLWELHNIRKSWKEMGQFHQHKHVATYECMTVVALRFEDLDFSKSNILNQMIGNVQGTSDHTFFLTSKEESSRSYRSDLVLEAVWFTPPESPEQSKHSWTKAFCFMNLRGKVTRNKVTPQEDFIKKYATCQIIFVEHPNLKDLDVKLDKFPRESNVIVVYKVNDNTNLVVKKIKKYTLLKFGRYRETRIAKELCHLIKEILNSGSNVKSLAKDGAEIAESLDITNTASTLSTQAFEVARIVARKDFNETTIQYKENIFKCQTARNQKEISTEMKTFLKNITSFSLLELLYLINLISKDYKEKEDATVISRMNENAEKETITIASVTKLKSYKHQLSNNSLSIYDLFREIGHIYSLSQSALSDIDFENVTTSCIKLFLLGFPIEIYSGASTIPNGWINHFLTVLTKSIPDENLLTLSMLGIQSSGKSTLLNSMFGTNFPVGLRQDNHALYIQLVKIDESLIATLGFGYLILIDTEGMGVENTHNNEQAVSDRDLATFVVSLSDITLVSISGEDIGKEHMHIFRVVAHACQMLCKGPKKPSIKIVQQSVFDIVAAENDSSYENIVLNGLNEAINEEHGQNSTQTAIDLLTDSTCRDHGQRVYCLPGLCQSSMNPPNYTYSEAILRMKQDIINVLGNTTKNKMKTFALSIQTNANKYLGVKDNNSGNTNI